MTVLMEVVVLGVLVAAWLIVHEKSSSISRPDEWVDR